MSNAETGIGGLAKGKNYGKENHAAAGGGSNAIAAGKAGAPEAIAVLRVGKGSGAAAAISVQG